MSLSLVLSNNFVFLRDVLVLGTTALAFYGALFYTWYRVTIESSSHNKPKETFFKLPSHVRVYLATSHKDVDWCIDMLINDLYHSTLKVVGLDTEWKSHHSLALLQLATENVCVLIRLCYLETLPLSLKEFLENHIILKTGVGIANDINLIFHQYQVLTRGCVDLQPLARRYGKTEGGSGLKALSKNVLNVNVNKSHHIRCGNWTAFNLNPSQINYSAIDAWVGYSILLNLYTSYGGGVSIYTFCRDVIDAMSLKPFSLDKTTTTKNSKDDDNNDDKEKKDNKNNNKIPKHLKVPKRQKALYENCAMLAPDGEHLCSINRKKVQWYLDRDLAVIVQEEPNIVIQLKKEPHGRGHAKSEYYLSKKENKCVVCSNEEGYVRFSIVPHAFRKYLPIEIKSRSSHDIVLLCQRCHRTASCANERMREVLMREHNKNNEKKKPLFKVDPLLKVVKSAACALQKSPHTLPPQRKEELIKILQNHFQKQEITEEDIDVCTKMEYKTLLKDDPSFESHEQKVMSNIKTIEEIEHFVKSWRRHFIESMRPMYLPTGWSIDHPVLDK